MSDSSEAAEESMEIDADTENVVATEAVGEEDEEDEVTVEGHADDDEDELTVKSDDASSMASGNPSKSGSTPKDKKPQAAKRGTSVGSSGKKGRTPSVRGLTIPFRTVKKAMKLDPDIPIVQNEAAVMATIAAEMFLRSLAKKSYKNAQSRGRNTIRYEDIAEARTNSAALSFLETLLP